MTDGRSSSDSGVGREYRSVVHCSIWTWRGDPDDLAARYEAMIATLSSENMQFSACARTADGIVVFDTCPSKAVFDAFSPGLREMLEAHGLGAPISVVDYPIVAAYALGRRIDGESPDDYVGGGDGL
jgi:hypothetical protein